MSIIKLSVPDRGCGEELNEILQFTSLYNPCVLHVEDICWDETDFPNIKLTDKEKEILQLCANEFTKIPTTKYANEIAKRMYNGYEQEHLNGNLIIIFKKYIVPKVRELTGREKKILGDENI